MQTPLTFSGVCQMVKNESDPKLIDAVDSILSVLLILGPTVAGMPAEGITTALGLIGAKNELVKLGKLLYKKFTKKEEDETHRQERMSAAFCLITYTAFFDALAAVTPEINKIVDLTDSQKLSLTITSRQVGNAETCPPEPTPSLADFATDLPHPAETLDQISSRLMPVYQHLAEGIQKLLAAFAAWESYGEGKRKETVGHLQELPRVAARGFRDQYFVLAATFPEFAVWSNLREHAVTQEQMAALSGKAQKVATELSRTRVEIDLGLKRLRGDVDALPRRIDDYRTDAVWRDLQKHYQAAIEQPILKDPTTTEPGKPTLTYPTRADIFIPQSFKALRYSQGMHLEHDSTWSDVSPRKDLGEFLLSYLTSPYSTSSLLIILGHPGSGKSLLSQMIAAQTMSKAFAPVRIELRSINPDNEVESQIEEQIQKDIARRVEFPVLMDSLNHSPAVIIFDGYDELLQATGQVFAGYLNKIHNFQDRESRTLDRNPVRAVVSSRVTLIDKAVIPEGTTVLRLLEFDDAQRQKWTSVWNRANKAYFDATKVRPFSVPKHPKITEISEQPLLLLMLALYDSTGNQLHRETMLDQSVLYESLLRRFIERERMKDPAFAEMKDTAKRNAEIDADMERLGVAALGMFNRQTLHIRAMQLDRDIEFFKLARTVPAGADRQLSQAELVLGSFFFVHQSTAQQRGDAGDEREADAVFEFLHNTFGEFLVGHFLITQLLRRTRELYKLRKDPELADHRSVMLADPNGLKPTWYVSLMHAPLFARP